MTNDKLPVFATRMNLKMINQKLINANKGHKLLKTKSDALNNHFRKVEEQMRNLNDNVNLLFKEAFLALSKAQFLGANVELFIKDSSKYPFDIEVDTHTVSGVTLPQFRVNTQFVFDEVHGHGATQFIEARILFKRLLTLLIEVSSIKNAYNAIKTALDTTNRRINALEHVIIPKLENTSKFIGGELDEQEREDFFRLKKIQSMNKK